MTSPPETERLHQLAALGDLDALARLMTEAKRRGDAALLKQTEASLHACARAAVRERAPSRALAALKILPPSEDLWDALCDLLPSFHQARIPDIIEDLSPYLAAWPDALRAAPKAWWTPTETLTLARTLHLKGVESPKALSALCDALPALVHLTDLSVQPAIISDRVAHHEALLRLLSIPQLANLCALTLEGCALLDEGCERLAKLPLLNTLQRLSMGRNMLRARAIEALTRTARMRALRHLDLSRNLLDDDALSALVHGPHLTALEHLELRDNGLIREQGAQTLARAPNDWQTRLLSLGLSRCQIGDEGLLALCRTAHLTRLTRLDLSANNISQAGTRALCRVTSLQNLRALNLSDNTLRDPSLMSLAHWPTLQHIEWLDLSANQLQPPALSEFCMSRHTASLQHLDLSANPLGDRAIGAIATSRQLTSLQTLRLRGCGLTDRSAAGLLASTLCRRLTHLDLSNVPPAERRHGEQMNRLGPPTAEAFAQAPAGSLRLQTLSLAFTQLSDGGAFSLARSPALENLTALDLTGCNLSPQAVAALIRSPSLARLERLSVRGNTLGPDSARALLNHLPMLHTLDFDPQTLTPEGLTILRSAPALHPRIWHTISPEST